MVYGASGYTGRMAAELARAAGLPLVLAARSREPLVHFAEELNVDYRAFDLSDDNAIRAALTDVSVLLNCAGPYMDTAEPLMRAAIGAGVHYLDIAAELDTYRLAEKLDDAARAAGVMLLPGGGGSVAMLGCLAGHAAARVEKPQKLAIALHVAGSMSRGSAISARRNLVTETLRLSGGQLAPRSPGETAHFDFGGGAERCFAVTLPDLITIGRATGIPDVETYVHVSGKAFPDGDLANLPVGPDAAERDANRYQAAVEVTAIDGTIVRSVLDTVNGYSFTPMAAAEAARRVLAGEVRPGFQTPVGLFGTGFAETIANTCITDIETLRDGR
ncbi:saccharopine dehydrogenase NADP-binding domain-containing protein [Sphingobium sp. 3R8]|uniref:saccharopine dehydrogenase family protein n=1 Tax=Sphingobium sp. 3R8 TaxID=2874921 RepID=UPI001CCBEED9|nr:saccharopine dehydrogenase NADP-binding domain-containing protein [Sphingobium sp. 3R8]MBZ9649784.1 saccharopine dehydrogenase NADP-binding domain-containing protein [Sphingobium sp. 3R8]